MHSRNEPAGEHGGLLVLLDQLERTMSRLAGTLGDAYLQHLRRFRA